MTAAPHPYDEVGDGRGAPGSAGSRAQGTDVVSLSEYGAILRRRALSVVGFMLLGLVLGWLAYTFSPKTYATDAVVTLVPPSSASGASRTDIATNTNTEKTIALSSEVSTRARDRLAAAGFYPQTLDHRVLARDREVTVVPQTQALEFRFSAERPESAAAGANAFAEAYLGYRADRAAKANKEQIERLRGAREARENDLTKLDARLAGTDRSATVQRERDVLVDQIADLRRAEDAARTASVRPGILVDRAVDPRLPVAPRFAVFAAGGLFLGLLAGLANAIRRERSDDRIRSGPSLAKQLGAPLLTSVRVPRSVTPSAALALQGAPDGPEADGYRIVAAKLIAPGVRAGRRILITGPGGGDPRVAPNVAIALAELGQEVTYVASLDGLRGLLRSPGSPSAEEVADSVGDAVRVASFPRLRAAALQDDSLADGVDEYLDEDGNVVVIDGSDLAGAWQVLALAGRVDSLVVVVDPRRAGRRSLDTMVAELRSVSARICGGVHLLASRVAPPPDAAGGNGRPARRGAAPTPAGEYQRAETSTVLPTRERPDRRPAAAPPVSPAPAPQARQPVTQPGSPPATPSRPADRMRHERLPEAAAPQRPDGGPDVVRDAPRAQLLPPDQPAPRRPEGHSDDLV